MAKAGDTLLNPVTGERMVFLKTARDTDGKVWQAEFFVPPHGGRSAVAHFHPLYAEQFDILTGAARYWVGGVEKDAGPGDVFITPTGTPHKHPWSTSDEVLHIRQTIELPTPDLQLLQRVDVFFETLYGLARDGKVGKDGLPHPLQFAVILYAFPPGLPGGDADPRAARRVRRPRWRRPIDGQAISLSRVQRARVTVPRRLTAARAALAVQRKAPAGARSKLRSPRPSRRCRDA